MHQSWDSSLSNFIGSTSVMSNNYEGQPWFSQQRIQIKSEPMEFNSRDSPPQTGRQQMSPLLEHITPFRQMGVFNPLTPPGYSGLMFPPFLSSPEFPKEETPPKAQDLSKTNPNRSENTSITPPMDVTPPKSPLRERTITQTPEKDDFNGLETRSESVESYDEESDEFEDDGSNVGNEKNKKRKSGGNNKPRQYKCKQCKLPFLSKREFWDHTRSHIKPEKMLQCPKCAFVTEYKHHLEYHLRNHSRVKPFRCPHCNYSCVNKSMLNSHLKSHSTVLQYRCLDCVYATKYCHSLKLHLRKYDHKPDIVLNLDGTPNPLPIIDVYGTRRGPKSKSTTSKLLAEIEKNQQQQQQQQIQQQKAQKSQQEFSAESAQKSQLSPPLTPSNTTATNVSDSIMDTPPSSQLMLFKMLQNQMLQNKMPLLPYFNLNFQMLAAQQQAQMDFNHNDDNDEGCVQTGEADTNFIENSPVKKPESVKTSRTKRKGKAFKLKASHSDDDFNSGELTPITTVEKVSSSITNETAEKPNDFECKFCGISFHDDVLFSLHSGYHSRGLDPFICNMCGTKTEDKVQFFLHIARFPHS